MSVAVKTPVEPIPEAAAAQPLPYYRFSVKQYQRMIETGVLTPEDRVELLEGWVVQKMTQNPPLAVAIDLAHALFRNLLSAEWHIREQKPIVTADSQPEPDLVVVRGPARRYAQRHPAPREIALAVEVADTTLLEDRSYKGRLYAQARIPVYWIINLVETKVEVYTRPKGGKAPAYRERRDYGLGDSVPVDITGQSVGLIPVRDLLA